MVVEPSDCTMRKLQSDNNGVSVVSLVGAAIAIFILLLIGITVFFNLAADLDPVSLDSTLESDGATEGGTVQNATNSSISMFSTFSEVAPVIGLVIIAVAVLGVIKLLG